jgi:hypothetical protein
MPRLPRLLIVLTALAAVAGLAAGSALASSRRALHSSPSTQPAAHNSPGPLLWTAPAPVDSAPIDALACPASNLCVAVDRAGRALWSTDPAGGARAWRAAPIDPGSELTSIACPSVGLCVAVDSAGNALTSTDPTGGSAAWSAARIDTSTTASNSDTAGPILLRGVSCPSSSLCVAVDADGNALTSTEPTGGAAAWTTVRADANRSFDCSGAGLVCQPPLIAVACPSIAQCAAVDFSGNVLTTQTPTGAGPWASASINGGRLGSLWGISCPSTSFCATVDGDANHVITFNPAAPVAPTSRALPDALYGVWCQSASLCLASAQTPGGLSGLLGSYDPGAPRATWSLSSPGAITGLSCGSPAVCVAVDGQGDALAGVSTHAVSTLLTTVLLPRRRLPSIAAIDRARRLQFVLTSPIAARVSLSWTLPGSSLTLGTVTHRFAGPGTARLTLPLTALGVEVFRAARFRVTVRATASFAASSGSLTVTGNRTFTHPPQPPRHRRRRHG